MIQFSLFITPRMQNKNCSAIEIIFKGIDNFNLRPEGPENYTCEIMGASLFKIGTLYFGTNEPEIFNPEDYSDEVTWVAAKEVIWRPLDHALGEDDFYCTKI